MLNIILPDRYHSGCCGLELVWHDLGDGGAAASLVTILRDQQINSYSAGTGAGGRAAEQAARVWRQLNLCHATG